MGAVNVPGLIVSFVFGVTYLTSLFTYDLYGRFAINTPHIRRPDLYKKQLENGIVPEEAKLSEFIQRNCFSL